MLYNTAAWVSRDIPRRTLRDDVRDKFFAELGGERLKDPFEAQPEPGANVGKTMALLAEAISLHMGDTSALTSMRTALTTLGLSHGPTREMLSLDMQLNLRWRLSFLTGVIPGHG